jgi:3-methyladenine DNA glycosylase AlkD
MNIIQQIRTELKQLANKEIEQSAHRFFKEGIQLYGIKTPVVRSLSKKYYQLVKHENKEIIFAYCNEFWMSGYQEEMVFATDWAYAQRKKFVATDWNLFEKWVNNYVTNWAMCDGLCNHTIGTFIDMFPERITTLKEWTQASNIWARRAAAVSLIVPAKQGKFLKDIFEIAELLLLDKEDLVQKGYGWMLKEAAEAHEKEVFDFVCKHKQTMPRTALRYAIEKMPKEMKAVAMAK